MPQIQHPRSLRLATAGLCALLAVGAAQAQPAADGWIVWETDAPVQRVAYAAGHVWSGHYKGGLRAWQRETGAEVAYTSGSGLLGDDILAMAPAGDGSLWVAAHDGSISHIGANGAVLPSTPPNLGAARPWDLAARDGDLWIATHGGGVTSVISGTATTTTTTYTAASSGLPSDDIYAIALDRDGSPWVGTIGYGVAHLVGGAWQIYRPTASIASPVDPSAQVANKAIVDIAVDAAGNKWFATDGSGVLVLDAANQQWASYTSANSGLSSDFVQSISIDSAGNYWFGTLGGGASRLSADRTTWQRSASGSTPLPDDDILGIVADAGQGVWMASYDTGLVYSGPLSAPLVEIDPRGKPSYTLGENKGYYVWLDPATYLWHVAWTGDDFAHTFSGWVQSDAPIQPVGADYEGGDSVTADGSRITFTATEQRGEDFMVFALDRAATQLQLYLQIDGAYYPYSISLGELGSKPATAPFTLVPPQPQPPQVQIEPMETSYEGDPLMFSGILTDTDSPDGHAYRWDLGDGTVVTDTLWPEHAYRDDGIFTTSLTITDAHGLASTAAITVAVENVEPEVWYFNEPELPFQNEQVLFVGSADDPGSADALTATWDFGDGSQPLVTSALTVTHSFSAVGTYTVTLQVADDDGGVGVASYPVQVVEGYGTRTPTPTSTPTPVGTPTSTPTPTATSTPTATKTPTVTSSPIVIPTSTRTTTPTFTVTRTPTVTKTPTRTPVGTLTPTRVNPGPCTGKCLDPTDTPQ
ncbi:PKD domain-containing protein [Chloroflexia bacterium SDU3-3]|nr:PKD domain-containing protein [Chloroflexia bacterium SDU3-3]